MDTVEYEDGDIITLTNDFFGYPSGSEWRVVHVTPTGSVLAYPRGRDDDYFVIYPDEIASVNKEDV